MGFSKPLNQPLSFKELTVHTPLGKLLERKESIACAEKEISLKNEGGININSICYTIFSKVICSALCSNRPPHEKSHMQMYSESTVTDNQI